MRRLATIVSLLLFSAPLHVPIFVVTFIADSVNGMRWRWLWAKLRVELFERGKEKLDSSATIKLVSVMVWGIASLLRAGIRNILRAVLALPRMAVLHWANIQASTAFSIPGSKGIGPNDCALAAPASAEPHRTLFACRVEPDYGQKSERFSRKIDESRAVLYRRILFSHVVPTSIGYCLVRAGRERQFLLGSLAF